MTRNPVSNVVYSFVVWAPLLAIVVGVIWVLCIGAMHLEIITNGSQVFVPNSATSNMPAWRSDPNSGNAQASQLMDALNSGDENQMAQALGRYNAGAAG